MKTAITRKIKTGFVSAYQRVKFGHPLWSIKKPYHFTRGKEAYFRKPTPEQIPDKTRTNKDAMHNLNALLSKEFSAQAASESVGFMDNRLTVNAFVDRRGRIIGFSNQPGTKRNRKIRIWVDLSAVHEEFIAARKESRKPKEKKSRIVGVIFEGKFSERARGNVLEAVKAIPGTKLETE